MQSAHDTLINLFKELGYKKDTQGLCHGTTVRLLEAHILGEQNKFIERINKIINTENLEVLIKDAQEKVKKHQTLTKNEVEILAILPFFDSLSLYQTPNEFYQIFGEQLSQNKIEEIAKFANSEKIQDKGGLTSIYDKPNSFENCDLKQYLHSIQKAISDNKLNPGCNLGMVLSNTNHTIGLFYDATNNKWTFMDINQWPPTEIILDPTSIKNSYQLFRRGLYDFSSKPTSISRRRSKVKAFS